MISTCFLEDQDQGQKNYRLWPFCLVLDWGFHPTVLHSMAVNSGWHSAEAEKKDHQRWDQYPIQLKEERILSEDINSKIYWYRIKSLKLPPAIAERSTKPRFSKIWNVRQNKTFITKSKQNRLLFTSCLLYCLRNVNWKECNWKNRK